MGQGHGEVMTLEWRGTRRKVLVHDPPGAAATCLPLVLALHGTGGTARLMAILSGFNRLANERGFRVVYPQALGETGTEDPGLGAAWNAGPGTGCPLHPDADDEGFLSAVVAQLVASGRADPQRCYVAGFSNGARMVYRLALEAPWVAAVATVAGAPVWGTAPVRPVPTLAFHGTEDRHIPFEGGEGSLGRRLPTLGAVAALARWAGLMGCVQPEPEVRLDPHTLRAWSAPGCTVGLWTVAGMGHAWPGGRRYAPAADPPAPDLSATHLIWAFFDAHTLESPCT